MIGENKIRQVLLNILDITEEESLNLSLDDDLINYGLDSIKAIELVVTLEELFNISVNEEDLLLKNLSTINKLIGVIQNNS